MAKQIEMQQQQQQQTQFLLKEKMDAESICFTDTN